jgi:hypothetical protein
MMFCPKCASQNVEGASFCRSCGANISLVPQALTGQLPTAQNTELRSSRQRKRRHQASVEDGVGSLMTGVGFLAVALALAFFGRPIGAQVWWFWLLIPAFGMMGRGLSEIMRAKNAQQISPPAPPQMPYAQPLENLPPKSTSELHPSVPSVTEGTTRHLGVDSSPRHLESSSQKPS